MAQDVSTGLGCGAAAIAKVSTLGDVVVVSSACVSGTGYHCASALKLRHEQSGFSSSQVKATGASKLVSVLWGSSAAASSSLDESKVVQLSISARASVETPAAPSKSSIVWSADTAGAVCFLFLILVDS